MERGGGGYGMVRAAVDGVASLSDDGGLVVQGVRREASASSSHHCTGGSVSMHTVSLSRIKPGAGCRLARCVGVACA